MKLKFKKQPYQTRAVESVVDCFKGQPNTPGISYRIDPGVSKTEKTYLAEDQLSMGYDFHESGFRNGDIFLTEQQLLENGSLSESVGRGRNRKLS